MASQMPSTMWTAILQVHQDPERIKDLVVRRYRDPIFQFAIRQSLPREDAEDVTQEVFLRVCSEDFLAKADRSKGKFRSLLLAVARHVIGNLRQYQLAEKRDRRREVRFEDFEIPSTVEPDGVFDQLWAANLVRQARERLKDDIAVQALNLFVDGRSYQQIAEAMGKKEADVTNYLHRAKEKLRREIERLIAEYSSVEDLPGEISTLLNHM